MKNIIILILSIFTLLSSCKKYLDQKPVKSSFVPTTLQDLEAMLNNDYTINRTGTYLAEMISDNYYISTSDWQSRSLDERLNYIWDPAATDKFSYQFVYQGPIYISNVVLDQLVKLSETDDKVLYDKIKGTALFYRAYSFLQAAQLYCAPYSSTTAGEPGIILRLTSNINTPSVRSSVQGTYEQIINDLKTAIDLLPDTTPYLTQPAKPAAFAALARTYLFMRDYNNAGKYADSALNRYHTLINYNTLTVPAYDNPFPRFHQETLFYSAATSSLLYNFRAKIDSTLFQSYHSNDLRKTFFFFSNSDGSYSFRASYDGERYGDDIFNGLATDEVYFIRAECYARNGNTSLAMTDLNMLMQNRWKSNNWTPFTAANATDALGQILAERRKELLYRGLRWSDLRRFNLDGQNITIKRIINNATYTLLPNDPRWILLFPSDVINLSEIDQNER